ncbi:MAG: tetratricopeptide repeat protein [Streptosporangiaceae bacterium]|nr:tetratricopeptide repeat protein [Streptosporangiaceae bacterium]MBV9858268.1 tetratricopeptide repeat protein [Streptosporangiaceae bacterium]
MRFRMLGPLEVSTGDDWQGIRARKWKSVLAALLLNAGQIVPTDSLIFELWGDQPPAKARNLISIYVLRLRGLMGDAEGRVLVTHAPGYRLITGPGDLDARRFEALVADGRRALAAADPERAAGLLTEALGLWRGSVLADVPPSALIEAEAERLGELRLTALELRMEADLACGRSAQVIPELRGLVAENQIREGLWLLLMRALDGAGRHAEALDTYAQAREAIADQLGVDPGAELQQLYQKILAADVPDIPARAAPAAGAAGGTPGADAGRAATPPEPAEEPAADAAFGSVPGTISVGAVAVSPPAPGAQAPAAEAEIAAPLAAEQGAGPAQPRPAQLPADIGDFTGRGDHVLRLREILTRDSAASSPGAVPIALVAGAGGLGKTTLAVHAAHQIRGQFPDGQLYVDLLGATAQPMAPGDVLARFLRDLGVEGVRIPASDEERAALYRTRLTGRRMLIVLDNARDTAQVRPLLPGSASCAVLITTRGRMPGLATSRHVDLNVLDDVEALALFTRIVDDERPEAEPDATAEVLLACAGLPLAIRICAARLAARPHWRIATMASRLRNERRRLDELRTGDLEVRASFQVSYASLQAPDSGVHPARAFRLLGLWHGPTISLPAAAALIGETEDQAADVLEGLVDSHLLECSAPDRYRFHDLLRVYAEERAQAEEPKQDREDAVNRILTWYLHTAEAAARVISPQHARVPLESLQQPPRVLPLETLDEALEWGDSERFGLRVAVGQGAESGRHEIAWKLAAAAMSYLYRRSHWADWVAITETGLDSARKLGDRLGEARMLNNLGMAFSLQRMEQAVDCFEQARAAYRLLGDPLGEARAANNIAFSYFQLGRFEEALDAANRSLVIQREAQFRYGEGRVLGILGGSYCELGRYDDAIKHHQQALVIYRELGDRDSEADALNDIGDAYLGLKRLNDAIDCLQQSLGIRQAIGDRHGQAETLARLGLAQKLAGKPERARELLAGALEVFEELEDRAQAAEARRELAALGEAVGRT